VENLVRRSSVPLSIKTSWLQKGTWAKKCSEEKPAKP
jgi:hypothetical protein